MARIGNWGSKIRFIVSENTVRTFKDLKHTVKVRTSTHAMAYGKPKVEYLGMELETATFTMELHYSLGASPKSVRNKIRKAIKNGEYHPLVVGGDRIMKKAQIISVSESYETVLRNGKVESLKLDVSMQEYN